MRPIGLLLVVVFGLLPRTTSPQGGVPLGPEFRVNAFTTGSQLAPALASDIGGDFLVVWESAQDGSGNGVFGQRYNAGGTPLGPEFLVNTVTTGNQSAPAATSDISGNFVVVWVSDLQDGSGLGVFGQRFASSGAPAGPEFRVNSFTTGDQAAPSVAIEKSHTTGAQRHPIVGAPFFGNFAVVWASDAQDGSSYGVFGQRYSMIVPVELLRFGVE